jgi:hypothetical protein
MVRWVYTFLSQNNLSYIFESKSGVIGSFFLIGTDKRLFPPSKIVFPKPECRRTHTCDIMCQSYAMKSLTDRTGRRMLLH